MWAAETSRMSGVASSLPLWLLGWVPVKYRACRCTTTRMLRDCHFHIWGTWCRLQTVPWYTYMNLSQIPAPGMLALRLRKGCQWSSKFHPCGHHYRHEWLPVITGNPVVVVCCCLLLFVVVCCCCCFVLLFLLTRSNRLQPIVIPSQRFLAIITLTCCTGPVCSLVMLGDNNLCVVWPLLKIIIIIVFICIAPYLRNYNSVQRRLLQHWHDYKTMLNHTSDSTMAVER